MDTTTNPPGLSPVYATARDMLAALDKGDASAHHWAGTLMVRVVDGGNYRAAMIDDELPLHPDTLALWAAAFGQPADGWQVDSDTGGRVARLEWPTDGEASPESRGFTWLGGKL